MLDPISLSSSSPPPNASGLSELFLAAAFLVALGDSASCFAAQRLCCAARHFRARFCLATFLLSLSPLCPFPWKSRFLCLHVEFSLCGTCIHHSPARNRQDGFGKSARSFTSQKSGTELPGRVKSEDAEAPSGPFNFTRYSN
jgi:hypothetical protein